MVRLIYYIHYLYFQFTDRQWRIWTEYQDIKRRREREDIGL